MKRRIFVIMLAAMALIVMVLASGCSGTMDMLTGRWSVKSTGDQYGGNQQDPFMPISVDIYPDHTIRMFDDVFGTWTMDRNTYTFKSKDGQMDISGSFALEVVDQQSEDGSGNTTKVPQLTVYVDGQPVSYVLQKKADLGPLKSFLRAQASASAAAAAASKQPAATATAAQ